MWNRTLSAAEIAQVASYDFSGAVSDMVIDLRFDKTFGTYVTNQGSLGSAYDAVLGAYASGVSETSTTLADGAGCGSSAQTTMPVWVNKTSGFNTRPEANNMTASVVETTTTATTSVTMYFTGSDADGDLLDYAVTRLPTHGALYLVSSLDSEAAAIPITSVPFYCWHNYSRYAMVWWPEEGSNDDGWIGVKAWDGTDFSQEALIDVIIEAVDGVPTTTAPIEYHVDEDSEISITLSLSDRDSDFTSIFITELPSHGRLFTVGGDGNRSEVADAFSAWDVQTPIEQFASTVRAVSSFYAAGDDAGNGRPSWHPYQILGEGDVERVYGDSAFAYCPSTLQGMTNAVASGGDEYISFSHNTWASYLAYGYTEFIEVGYDQAVYVQSVETGECRGMGSIVNVKAWDDAVEGWQTLFSGEADIEVYEQCKKTNTYYVFEPTICQTTFATSRLRLEMDTYAIVDWDEIDYVKLIGATVAKSGVINANNVDDADKAAEVIYVPDENFAGVDSFMIAGSDCAYFSSRTSDSTTVPLVIGAVNDAPISMNIETNLTCNAGDADVVSLSKSVIELDGDSVVYNIESLPLAAMLRDGATMITESDLPFALSGDTVSFSLAIGDGAELQPSSFDFTFSASDPIGARSAVSTTSVSCSAVVCGPGFFYSIQNGTCSSCPDGTADAVAGMRSECAECPKGFYSKTSVTKGLTCVTCADGYGEGYFSEKSRSASCERCPNGATCPRGQDIILDEGRWRTSDASLNVLACPKADGCKGGNASEPLGLCADGYEGVLCAVCTHDHYSWGNTCKRCSDDVHGMVVLTVFGMIAILAGVVVIGACGHKLFNVSKVRYARLHKKLVESVWDVAKFKGAKLLSLPLAGSWRPSKRVAKSLRFAHVVAFF